MAFRLATTRERLADELLAEAAAIPGERAEKQAAARAMYAQAADDYLRHAKLATMQDNVSANSLWRAAQLLDKAGKPLQSVAVYEQFTAQRPRDPRVSEGLLATGRLYQSAGMLDRAIAVYERDIRENPKTPGAYASAVSVARCYMMLGEESAERDPAGAKALFDRAERSLLSLVQENNDLLPSANEFRISLFTLGELYYRNHRWADAILRLEEAVERYPKDKGVPRALFMLAESFRKSAAEIGDTIRKDPAIAGRDALESARAERLLTAAGIFTRVIGLLDVETQRGPDATMPGSMPAITPLEMEYVRTSYMDRAECHFDRGDYPMAIKLYDEAATRFAEQATAVQAYVQIVNAYLALKEPTQASAAAERGRWILKRIPDEAFDRNDLSVGREYYERLLALGKN